MAAIRRRLLQKGPSAKDGMLVLENKYFTANVLLQDIELESTNANDQWSEDGVILAFVNQSAAAFDAAAALHQMHHNRVGDLLRLCVGVGENKLADESEYSRRVLWCLDHGYEYVEADLSDEGVSRGHEERDKEGFARIIEAIEGTVWSTAVMKSRQSRKIVNAYQEETIRHEISSGEYIPPTVESMISTGEDNKRELQAQEALLPAIDDSDSLYEPEDEHKDDGCAVSHSADTEVERSINDFDSTLREFQRIRETSRSSDLSDEDRKRRAGDAAALLLNLMGDLDMDSSDEEESS